jgi:poly [ADP-ribose] polymerase
MAVISNKCVIDEQCSIKGGIFSRNNMVYSCTLNQTDIKTNKNKFYIMQLVYDNDRYYVYSRWGRIGEKGQCQLKQNPMNGAIMLYEKTFKTKTGNIWGSEFRPIIGKYYLTDVKYDFDDIDEKKPELVSKLDDKRH